MAEMKALLIAVAELLDEELGEDIVEEKANYLMKNVPRLPDETIEDWVKRGLVPEPVTED